MNTRIRFFTVVALAGVANLLAFQAINNPVQAATVSIAVEAESGTFAVGTASVNFTIGNDAVNASGGQYISETSGQGTLGSNPTATYSLNMPDPTGTNSTTTWYLYVRLADNDDGSSNVGSSFGNPAASHSYYVNNYSTGGYTSYHWINVNKAQDLDNSNADSVSSLGAVSYDSTGGAETLIFHGREQNLRLDKFVLSTSNDLTSNDLDAVVVPEPSSALLAGLSLLGLGFVRRRRNS